MGKYGLKSELCETTKQRRVWQVTKVVEEIVEMVLIDSNFCFVLFSVFLVLVLLGYP